MLHGGERGKGSWCEKAFKLGNTALVTLLSRAEGKGGGLIKKGGGCGFGRLYVGGGGGLLVGGWGGGGVIKGSMVAVNAWHKIPAKHIAGEEEFKQEVGGTGNSARKHREM